MPCSRALSDIGEPQLRTRVADPTFLNEYSTTAQPWLAALHVILDYLTYLTNEVGQSETTDGQHRQGHGGNRLFRLQHSEIFFNAVQDWDQDQDQDQDLDPWSRWMGGYGKGTK